MGYVDGFVCTATDREAYRAFAAKAVPIFKDHGAIRVVESWGDDVAHGKRTDFFRAVDAREGETVVFSWIEWPSKEVRDVGWKAAMEDERMTPPSGDMPFDGERMIYGGFAVIVDE